jgi:tetratricopeptide (TPR) repeat protein/predicted MPP superfamily phosphohydrolase
MPMTKFRWLHISDFHLGMKTHEVLWPNMEALFFKDLEQVVGAHEPLDLVLFTGDLVQTGRDVEFAALEAWLRKLSFELASRGHNPAFLAVPGNHDLVRPPASDPTKIALCESWTNAAVQESLWSDAASPYRAALELAFAEYSAWWKHTALAKPANVQLGCMPGDFSATIEKEGYQLGIIGLNSAFLQLGGENAEGKLALDVRQLNAVCNGHPPEWIRRRTATLLLTHHPVSWLYPGSRAHFESEIHAPPERFAVHLCGHLHENKHENISVAGGIARLRYQAASLFGLETFGPERTVRSHGYCIGTLQIADTATISFQPRKVDRRHDNALQFVRDNRFSLQEADGATAPCVIRVGTTAEATSNISRSPLPTVKRPPGTIYRPQNAAFLVPFRAKGKYMVGGDASVTRVREQLVSGRPTNIGQTAVFQGIGGLGKTQLAVEYAYRYRDDYPSGVYWITADENIDAQLTEIAVRAMWVTAEAEHATKLAVARHRLKSYSDCLIVFDNVESADAIRDYFPEPPATPHILVTSRREQQEFVGVYLDLLDSELSYALLVQESRKTPTTLEEEAAAREIVVCLGGLPLALELAGAYIARRPISWRAYCQLLNADLRKALPTHLTSLTAHESDLFKTLQITEGDIHEEPFLLQVLDLLTWSGSSPMGVKLMAYMLDVPPTELYGALALGDGLRVLSKTPEAERYAIHRLVQEVRRRDRRLNECGLLLEAISIRIGDWFEHIRDDFSSLPLFELEFEHLKAWQINAAGMSATAIVRFLWLQAFPAYHRGRYDDAMSLVNEAVAVYATHGLDEPVLKAHLLHDRSKILTATGQPQQAFVAAREALDLRRQALGEDAVDTARAMQNLATAHGILGDYKSARDLGTEAVRRLREVPGRTNSDVPTALSGLAQVHAGLGEFSRALELETEALNLKRELLGAKHPDVAQSLGNLAVLHTELGDYPRSLELAQQSLSMRKELLGEKHPAVAVSSHLVANSYASLGNVHLALSIAKQVLTTQVEVLGGKHPDVIHTYSSLAGFQGRLGNYAIALELGTTALTLACEILGDRHPNTTGVINNLAVYYAGLGDHEHALEFALQALKLRRELLGETHPDVAYTLGTMSEIYAAIGNNTQALDFAEQALSLRRKRLGDTHPRTVISLTRVIRLFDVNPLTARRAQPLIAHFLQTIPRGHRSYTDVLELARTRKGFRMPRTHAHRTKRKRR